MKATGANSYPINALEHLLGEDVLIVASQKRKINPYVFLETWEVNFPEHQLPNQFGQLICPHLDNERMSIQLMYLQHHFSARGTAIVFSLYFDSCFFAEWDTHNLLGQELFTDSDSGLQIVFCKETQVVITEFLQFPLNNDFAEMLRQVELSLILLRKATEQITASSEMSSVPACRFLNNNTEREKVVQAKNIMELEFDQILSVKQLSHRVAINECYLKKGFKAMYGKTINEYQQHIRITHAKKLLQTEGHTVSDVAHILGYSSISHFSTAFKKATNMKPCELLK
jgi:AraC-like DNA-binding protein/aryl carrier-like protein